METLSTLFPYNPVMIKQSNKMSLFLNLMLMLLITTSPGCQKAESPNPDHPVLYREFASVTQFNHCWDSLAALTDSAGRISAMNQLWDSLKINKQIPFCLGDTAVFMYKGASEPRWAGDFNGWNPEGTGWTGQKIGTTNFWRLKKRFPEDARLDYKIVAGSNWILDPANPLVQYSGFGPNSMLAMPLWVYPQETIAGDQVAKGSLSENKLITSSNQNLGYNLNYKVYLPYNYEQTNNCPVIYVTDGHEYSDNRLGAMVTVLDNLIFQGKIRPVIAVFVDPRDPLSGNNRRMDEYRANERFVNFLADELSVAIDEAYKTNVAPTSRAIMGTSLGGWNAAFVGLTRPDRFNLTAIHSPAFDQAIIENFSNTALLPLKVYMSTGTINDTQVRARQMKAVMESKAYPLLYREVNEGHSWGNWRALIDEPLIYFFGI